MRKISLILVSIFALTFVNAQEVEFFAYEQGPDETTFFPITDNNHSVIFLPGSLSDFVGGLLQAYVGDNPVSPASPIALDGAGGVAVIGSSDGYTVANPGDELRFAILMNGEVIVITNVNPPVLYEANGSDMIGDGLTFTIDGNPVVKGCTDSDYVEYYVVAPAPVANLDDGTCATLAVFGCLDAAACNYDDTANMSSDVCTYVNGICDTCVEGEIVDNDADNDGVCDADEILGCTDDTACNYDDDTTTDTDNSLCVYAADLDACATCSGETDGSGSVVDNDADDDGVCDADEVPGCTDELAFNYNPDATDDNSSCYPVIFGCINPSADNYTNTGDVMTDANTDDGTCEYSGINPWGPNGGSQESPTYITGNNMSVLIQAGEGTNADNFSTLNAGDIIFAAYVTSTLDNEYLGYSEINGLSSAGAVVFTGGQIGLPVFGAGNVFDNGFEEGEELIWLVEQVDDAGNKVIRNASLNDASGNPVSISYENGEYAIIHDIVVGSPFYDGCMDATTPSYNPLATFQPEGACAEPYSIGCMDMSAVNYAGPGANPTHDNAENFGNAFQQNLGYNLNTHAQNNTFTAANFSDDSMCQDQVEGCTDPMALNYDPYATQNDDTVCDWDLFKVTDKSPSGMVEYNVDANGFIDSVDYNFGHVDPENVNDGIVNSDFDRAQQVLAEGGLLPEEHVIDNLSALMEWVDMDEDRDETNFDNMVAEKDLAFHLNDSTWNSNYDLMVEAKDFSYDSLEAAKDLAFHINDSTWNSNYNLMVAAKNFTYDSMVVEMTNAFNAMVDHKDSLYDALMILLTGSADGSLAHSIGNHYYLDGGVTHDSGILPLIQSALDYHASDIVINLHEQWNTVGYSLHHKTNVVEQFISIFGNHFEVVDHINIVKNNEGLFYWPEFNFDGLGELIPGQGYQVRVKEGSGGNPTFAWDSSIDPGQSRLMTPTVPAWALEMEVETHPNDIRTLVRVVNMLGQEVNPTDQFSGEVLLYLYNDGTVEKKIVK